MREWLWAERKKRKMTQFDLAEQAGISRAYLTQIELEQRNPSIKVAKRLARVLSCEWTRFYEQLPAE
jgi:transcriptional regulator with XRE-family HTH domain